MTVIIKIFLLLFVVLPIVSTAAVPGESGPSSQPASLSETIENAVILNGKSLLVEGELIGEPLAATDGYWLNILENGCPLAVFVPTPATDTGVFEPCRLLGGNHLRTGHFIRVTGKFNRVCVQHGGDLDLHADGVEMTALPSPRTISVTRRQLCFLALQAVMALVLYCLYKKTAGK